MNDIAIVSANFVIKKIYRTIKMRALFFALVASTAYAFSDYHQSYVQTDSEYIDGIQRDEPIELPEVYDESELNA